MSRKRKFFLSSTVEMTTGQPNKKFQKIDPVIRLTNSWQKHKSKPGISDFNILGIKTQKNHTHTMSDCFLLKLKYRYG